MFDFKTKFEFSLKNAERILDIMKHTHRQRISQRQDEAQKTFQSKDDLTLPMVRSVAQRLQYKFFVQSLKQYDDHLQQIQNNQQNALKTLQKMAEKYKQLEFADDHLKKLILNNQKIDDQIKKWQQQDQKLTNSIKQQEFLQMILLEQTQKDIRGILDAQYQQNVERMAFTQRWNSYLLELKQMPKTPEVTLNTKIVKKSSIEDSIQETRTLKRSTHDHLLGDLKEFSKNLKIPKKKE